MLETGRRGSGGQGEVIPASRFTMNLRVKKGDKGLESQTPEVPQRLE